MFYTVCYNEGTCGSFIASLLILMLSEDTTTTIPITLNGSCESLYGRYSDLKLDLSDFKSFEDVFKIKPRASNKDGFTVWKGVESFVDCDEADRLQSNWHQLIITHEIEELLPIRLMHWFKGDRAYYQRFYEKHKDKISFEISDIRSLDYDTTVKFLKEFIPINLADEFSKFDQNVPSVWDKYYQTLSDRHKGNFTTIKFSDILGNPREVLDTLSRMTGKPISSNVERNYQRYLDAQKVVFGRIFQDPGIAPVVNDLL